MLHIICTNVQVFYLAGSSERHLLKYFILLCLDPTSFIFQLSDFEPSKHHKQINQIKCPYFIDLECTKGKWAIKDKSCPPSILDVVHPE